MNAEKKTAGILMIMIIANILLNVMSIEMEKEFPFLREHCSLEKKYDIGKSVKNIANYINIASIIQLCFDAISLISILIYFSLCGRKPYFNCIEGTMIFNWTAQSCTSLISFIIANIEPIDCDQFYWKLKFIIWLYFIMNLIFFILKYLCIDYHYFSINYDSKFEHRSHT